MGTINMNLLKGIEEQENMIDKKKIEQKELEQQKLPEKTQPKLKTSSKRSSSKQRIPEKENDEKEGKGKPKKQVFSFRATVEDIINWKAYATATGQTMEIIGTAAMKEYLTNHVLTGTEQTIFEAVKERDKNK